MKKYFIITLFLLFIASTFSFAQENNSDLIKSQKQVEKQQKELKRQQNRVEKKQKKVQRMNRKLEKQQKRLKRQNRKLNKENRRSNKEIREMEREQKKLEEAKTDTTGGALLFDRRKLIFPTSLSKSQYLQVFLKRNSLITLNRKYTRKSILTS